MRGRMALMAAFGRRSGKDDSEDASAALPDDDVEAAAAAEPDDEEPEGPFDIDDFDDPAVAELARLDLGSATRSGLWSPAPLRQ